jgi:dolichol-phosphate mannosyltransferase
VVQLRPLVVVPTYQEADNVLIAIDGLRAAAPDAEILVVDDGSPDGTADLVAGVGLGDAAVHVLRRQTKSGLGGAYRAGFEWARLAGFDPVVEMDADLSHNPADVPRLVGAIADGAHLAIGSRYVRGGATPDWPRRRRLLSRAGNLYASGALRLGVRDATAGFRAWRMALLDAIDMTTVRSNGYAFQVEMTYRAVSLGAHVHEVPIVFTDRARGASKMSNVIVREALESVTRWAVADRLTPARRGGLSRAHLDPATDETIDLTAVGLLDTTNGDHDQAQPTTSAMA